MPACGAKVGGKFSYRRVVSDRLIKDRFIADAAAKCEIGFEAGCEISGLGRTFKAGACRGVKVAYDCEARAGDIDEEAPTVRRSGKRMG